MKLNSKKRKEAMEWWKKRKEAMEWWNNLSSDYKTQICDTNTELVGSIRRWETLTSREIEILFELHHSEHKTNF